MMDLDCSDLDGRLPDGLDEILAVAAVCCAVEERQQQQQQQQQQQKLPTAPTETDIVGGVTKFTSDNLNAKDNRGVHDEVKKAALRRFDKDEWNILVQETMTSDDLTESWLGVNGITDGSTLFRLSIHASLYFGS